jgi:hypothetical protein
LALSLFTTAIAVPVGAFTIQLVKVLAAQSPQANLNFGQAVSIFGDRIVVSEHLRDLSKGRVYLFHSNGNYITSLQSPSPQQGADFGWSVGISSDKIVVGEPQPFVAGGTGRAYVFDSNGNFIMTLRSPSPLVGGWFGSGVAVGGGRIVVGESANLAGGQGKVYVFDSNGNPIATLQSSSPQANAWFGYSVAISGDRIVVGEPLTNSQTGKGYLFDLNGNPIATLQSSSPQAGAWFGWSVSGYGNQVVVGEPQPFVAGGTGRAYVFDSNGNPITTLQSSSPQASAWFGWSVSDSGDFIMVGETRGASSQGRAYLFTADGNPIGTLQSPSPKAGLYAFGWSVAVSGGTAVVSEPTADSSSLSNAGQAYVYSITGTVNVNLHLSTYKIVNVQVQLLQGSTVIASRTVTLTYAAPNAKIVFQPVPVGTLTVRINGYSTPTQTRTITIPPALQTVNFNIY